MSSPVEVLPFSYQKTGFVPTSLPSPLGSSPSRPLRGRAPLRRPPTRARTATTVNPTSGGHQTRPRVPVRKELGTRPSPNRLSVRSEVVSVSK